MASQNNIFKSSLNFPNKALAHLFSRLETQNLILFKIRKALPQPLAQHVCHCVIKHKKLVLFTDSAVWGSQLRFYNKAILNEIAPFTQDTINILQIRILTGSTGQETTLKKSANIPSVENINIIQEQALAAPDDVLNRALLKLSKTLKRLSE